MTLRVVLAIVLALVAPAVGLITADIVMQDIRAAAPVGLLCPPWEAPSAICQRAFWTAVTREVGVLSGVVFVALILGFVLLARIAGASRQLNAAIFPRLAPVTTFLIGVLVLVQGAVLTGAVYLLGDQFLGFWRLPLAAAIGLGALVGGATLLWRLILATAERPTAVLGRAMSRAQAPDLWAYVEELADRLGAQKPKNIIVGLEPNFFATAASVRTPERKLALHGESLYLSLPLMRLFTQEELDAVIAHELGHFRGADTAFSMRFAPVYRDLTGALASLSGENGDGGSLATAPARMALSLMIEAFARNERRISRIREFEADQTALEVASVDGLATSLAKVAIYAPLWGKVRRDNVARLSEGKVSRNLSKVYEASARYDVTHRHIGEILRQVLEARIAHPTDSHPAISQRYEAVGFEPRRLNALALTRQGASSAPLFKDLEQVEADLTLIEHRMMVASGHATPPDGAPAQNQLLNATYILAATMVGADGAAHPQEVQVAEQIGRRMFQDFDPVSFRETFDHRAELPDFLKVVELLDPPLDMEAKRMIHAYLTEIATIDDVVTPGEKALLDQAARIWGLRGIKKLLRRS